MSAWEPDRELAPNITPASGASEGATSQPSEAPFVSSRRIRLPWWLRAVPFFLSASLFLSGIFALFAPLPLLLLGLQARRGWAWLAAITNAALVFAVAGPELFWAYVVLIVTLALSLSTLLLARRRVEAAAGWTLAVMFAMAAGVIAYHSYSHHVSPVAEVKGWVSSAVDTVDSTLAPDAKENLFDGAAIDEIKHTTLVQLPWGLAFVSLLLIWVNLMTVLRINPNRIRERLGMDPAYFRRWKAPEWLVWPTIVSGALVLWDIGHVSEYSLNLFRFLMAIYALQGLSILGFLFDLWNVRGFFRTVGYLVAVFLMMPLLLSMGFFDLWFDFRGKLRQSS